MTTAPRPTAEPSEQFNVWVMILMHDAMRTDLARLVAAVDALDVDDRVAPARLARWFEGFRSVLEHHHQAEDDVFFPVVRERAGDRFAQADRLASDHHRIDDLLVDVTTRLEALATIDTDRASTLACLTTDVSGLQHLLDTHLDVEEDEVVPLMAELIGHDEMLALHTQAEKLHSPMDLKFLAPWILDHSNEEQRQRLVAESGFGIRVVERIFRRSYRRLDAALPTLDAAAPVDIAQPRRRLAAVVTCLTVVALAVILSGCGSDTESGTGAAAGAGPASVAEVPSTIEVTTLDHSFESSSEQVAAGPVTVRITNEGEEPHQVHLARLSDGMTRELFIDTFEQQGEAAAFDLVEWHGGVGSVEPGDTQEATSELPAGEYVMVCFIPTPGPEGESHVMKGMVGALEVVDAPTAASLPSIDTTVSLRDYAVDIPDGFDGGRVFVKNEGNEDHEFVVMRFDEGKSVTDLLEWSEAGMPEDRPFEYAGGVGTLEPGRTASTPLDLEPGDYIALCVVPGPEGIPHVEMGMVSTFTIS